MQKLRASGRAGLRCHWLRDQPWVDWCLGLSSWSGLRIISRIVVKAIAGRWCSCWSRGRSWLRRGSKPGIDGLLRRCRWLVDSIQSEGAWVRPGVVVEEWHLDEAPMKNAESNQLP